jgi:FkbM family methyltransferase
MLSIYKVYEETITNFIKENVKEGDVVLDVGAHIGYYTLLMSRLVGPSGKVYSFEPSPRNFAILKRNVKVNGYKNIILEQKAVSNNNGKANLYYKKDRSSGDSISKKVGDAFTEVDMVYLDDYLKEKKINFAKIDVEGEELNVLKGMKNILKNSMAISTEVSADDEGILNLLWENKFRIFNLDRTGINELRREEITKKDINYFLNKYKKYPTDIACIKK